MKKLMLVAAIAATTVAFGECKDGPTASSDAAVYVWQFKGKTSTAVKVTETYGGGCVDGGTTGCAIRVPGSLVITAYSYICDYYCESFDSLLGGSPTQFFASKPWKSTIYNTDKGDTAPFTIDVAHVIGKAASQYELEGVAKFAFTHASDLAEVFDLTFAGYGAYNKKTGIVTSVSGNFAGKQTPPRYDGKITKDSAACPPADYWDCQTLVLAGKANDPSVAYGTWSVKYNAAYSKKLAANKNWRVL
jgi:hypothetical protein